jgi:hypothetical protein
MPPGSSTGAATFFVRATIRITIRNGSFTAACAGMEPPALSGAKFRYHNSTVEPCFLKSEKYGD